jgi:hypothetical protein
MHEQTVISSRIGLFGTFDTGKTGDVVSALIFEREMRRRLPDLAVSYFTPAGWHRGIAARGGPIAQPFGSWNGPRRAELAAALDLAVITGPVIATREPQAHFLLDAIEDLPCAWHAVEVPFDFDAPSRSWVRAALQRNVYITVSDQRSQQRIEALDLECDVRVVPDPRLLVADLFPMDVLERRLRQLRAVGAYPLHGRPLLVQGAAMPETPTELDVVFVSATAEDAAAIRARRASADRKTYVLEPDGAVEDVIAAVAHARAVHGASTDLAEIAFAFGIPSLGAEDDPLARDALLVRLSAHFDRLAELAERSAARRFGTDVADLQRRKIASLTGSNALLRKAHQTLRERAAAERVLFAEAVNRLVEGDLTPAMLVRENDHLLREWSDARHARTVAEMRTFAAEERAEALEMRIEADDVRLRAAFDDRDRTAAELARVRDDLARTAAELARVRDDLGVAREENRRHRLVLGTRLVTDALRVQRWLATLRGK